VRTVDFPLRVIALVIALAAGGFALWVTASTTIGVLTGTEPGPRGLLVLLVLGMAASLAAIAGGILSVIGWRSAWIVLVFAAVATVLSLFWVIIIGIPIALAMIVAAVFAYRWDPAPSRK
jgi:hypothetical protein